MKEFLVHFIKEDNLSGFDDNGSIKCVLEILPWYFLLRRSINKNINACGEKICVFVCVGEIENKKEREREREREKGDFLFSVRI